MQDSNDKKVDRRTFLNTRQESLRARPSPRPRCRTPAFSARTIGSRWATSASAIAAAGLHMMASRLKDKHNVETVAVCDLWKNNRERAVANSEQLLRPRAARLPIPGGPAGAQGRRRRDDLDARSTRTRRF